MAIVIDNNEMGAVRSLLCDMLKVDTVQLATLELKKVLSDKKCLPFLMKLIIEDSESEIRQLSAVLVRKRVNKFWASMEKNTQEVIQKALLERLTQEPDHNVIISVAHVVAGIAKVSTDDWHTTLCDFLLQLWQGDKHHLEASILVFTSLLENASDKLEKVLPNLVHIFRKGMDPQQGDAICLTSLRGIQALTMAAETPAQTEHLRTLVEPLTKLVEFALSESNDEIIQLGIEILGDMIETSEVYKNEDIPHMVYFMLRISARAELDNGIRDQALNFIHWVARNRPKTLCKNGIVGNILDVVIRMAVEEEPIDLDEDSLSGHRVASQCMDSLALNLPNKYIYHPALAKLEKFMRSSDPQEKKAGLVLIGIMSEGCESIMRKKLRDLLPHVFPAFHDTDHRVQGAAATCFSQLAEYLQPEIFVYHEEAMKNLLLLLDSPNALIQEKACFALETFCEEMGADEIESYFSVLLPKLIHTLTNTSSTAVRQNCMGAIGASANASGPKFVEYSTPCLELLRDVLTHNGDNADIIALKGRATECIGIIAKSIGPANFAQFRDGFTELVFKHMDTINDNCIRRFSYVYFGNLAESIEADFAPYLEKVMTYIFATLFSSDGIEPNSSKKEGMEAFDTDDEDEDLDIRTGYLDELESAFVCLRALWDACGPHCMKYLHKTTQAIELQHQHFSSDVRELCATLIAAVVKSVHVQFPTDVTEFEPGVPVVKAYVHSHTMKLWEEMFWFYLETLLEDDDKETVTGVAISMGELLEELGPQLLANHIEELVSFVTKILSNKHECQKYAEVDNDEDSRVEEENLFEGVTLLVAGMSKTLGSQFSEIYARLHPRILSLSNHNVSLAYRCIGLGSAAATFHSMGTSAEPYVQSLVPAALSGAIQDEDLDLQRNAIYALGVFVEAAPSLMQNGTIMEILKALSPCFEWNRDDLTEKEHLVLDNAIGAVARTILNGKNTALPLNDIVPIFLRQLPLQEDIDESEIVMQALLYLFENPSTKEMIEANVLKFLTATVGELIMDKTTIKEETKKKVHDMNSVALRRLGTASPYITQLAEILPHPEKCHEYMRAIFC